jgi:tetratricopeptide (TPR) repeat protein
MDMAQTYSNICSIYSEMEKHEIALSYSKRAVEILQKEYDMRMQGAGVGQDQEKFKFISVVASGFHNAAVEYEYSGDYSNSLLNYNKAVTITKLHLGESNPVTQNFIQNFQAAKKQIEINQRTQSRKDSRVPIGNRNSRSSLGKSGFRISGHSPNSGNESLSRLSVPTQG